MDRDLLSRSASDYYLSAQIAQSKTKTAYDAKRFELRAKGKEKAVDSVISEQAEIRLADENWKEFIKEQPEAELPPLPKKVFKMSQPPPPIDLVPILTTEGHIHLCGERMPELENWVRKEAERLASAKRKSKI